MPDPDDHPRIPSVVPPYSFSDFPYDALYKSEQIGTGGDADVYHATIDRDGESYPVAIKEPRFEGTFDKQVLDRFQEEAETWAKLDQHDNIVTVYSWSATPVPWLALEYMGGGTLASKVGSSEVEEALWLSSQIAEGIRYGHRHGVAHLDLKPSNILLRETDGDQWPYPKVSDWGLAKLLLDHSNSLEGLSPTYAAPEQFDTDEYGRPDDITDIYQLGAVVYALVTGEPPFTGSATDVMQSVLYETPQPPSELNQSLSPEIDNVILKLLAKQKDERYQGVIPLLQDLDQIFHEYTDHSTDSEHPSSGDVTRSRDEGRASAGTPRQERSASGTTANKREPERQTESQVLSRRSAIGLLGSGVVGATSLGIYQLMVSDQSESTPGTPSTTDSTTDTETSPTPTPERETTDASRETPILSQRWSDWPGADYIWPVGSAFYFSGPHGAGRSQSSHLVWTGEANLENGQYHLPDNAFGYNENTVVFGFFADPGREKPFSQAGAHFYAHDRESGDRRWALAALDDGKHRRAVDATITSGIAALGCNDWAQGDQLVYGVDAELGDKVWQNSYSDRQLNAIVSHSEKFLLCFDTGLKVLDPNTGSEVDTRETLRTGDSIVSGNSLFTIDENLIVAYRLDENSVQWRSPEIGDISAPITAGNSLLAVGSADGSVHALDRMSGERLWKDSVAGEISRVALSAFNIWVRDTQGGVFALDRDDGEIVHRSTHGSEGGIAILDDILLMDAGDGSITAHWIEE